MGLVMNMGGKSPKQIVDEEKANNLIEAGAYEVALTKVEPLEKMSKDVPGKKNVMLRLTFTVQAGAKQGRTVQRVIGVDHSNDNYVNMSRAFISKLAIALGRHDFIGDLDSLMNRPVLANVIQTKPKENSQYGPQNDIKSFTSLGANVQAAPSGGWKKPEQAQQQMPLEQAQQAREPEMAGEAGPAPSTIAASGRKPWERAN